MKRYLKLIGEILLYLSIYIIPSGAAGVMTSIMVAAGNIERLQDTGYIEELVNKYIFVSCLFALLISAIILLFIFKYKKKNITEHCNFEAVSVRTIALSVFIGFMFNVFVNTVLIIIKSNGTLIKLLNVKEEVLDFAEGLRVMMTGNIFIVLLVVGILIPIFEEILYRGVIFNILTEEVSIKPAIFLQAAVFGLSHFNRLQGIYTFIFGIILVLCYYWLRSIWVPITVHVSFNLSNILIKYVLLLIPHNFAIIIPMMIVSLIFVFATLYFVKTNKETIYVLDGDSLKN